MQHTAFDITNKERKHNNKINQKQYATKTRENNKTCNNHFPERTYK